MKNIVLILITTFFLSIFAGNNVLALSNEFVFLLETMDIERVNQNGKEINEDVYKEYQLLVYGSPHDTYSGQRWKNVSTGHWNKNVGAWSGSGTRGEYWILGENYYGKEVHNHLFPVDIEPPTPPTEWRYAVISDALDSWQDVEKYMDDIQKEYMLSQNLTRNNTVYDLKIEDIGFDKVRVENYATWKTKGSVYTQRYDRNNKKWAANFLIPAMAADAELESFAKFPNGLEYTLSKEENGTNIIINYGSTVVNLTEYAKKEHVKEIKSQLYINNIFIDEYKSSETVQIEKNYNYFVNRKDYENQSILILNIEIRSTLLTKFTTDGFLTDVKTYTLVVYLDDEEKLKNETKFNFVFNEEYANFPEIPPPKITKIEIKRISEGEEKDLLIAKNTSKKFVCAGQTIVIRLKAINVPERATLEFAGDSSIFTLDSLTEKFEWTEPRERGEKTIVGSLKNLKQLYNKEVFLEVISKKEDEAIFEITYVIPYETKQTLHSWSTLRKECNNAFQINEGQLFSRIEYPYELVIKVIGPSGATTKRIELDVFERWDTLYNRDISKYIEIF